MAPYPLELADGAQDPLAHPVCSEESLAWQIAHIMGKSCRCSAEVNWQMGETTVWGSVCVWGGVGVLLDLVYILGWQWHI